MKLEDVYDPQGGHEKCFARLSPVIQMAITQFQIAIQSEVDKKNPGKFRPTSGFRSPQQNAAVGGVVDSLHIWGMARDFVPFDGDFSVPPSVCSRRFLVRRSARCWHVEVKG